MSINHRLRVVIKELREMGNMEDIINEIEDVTSELSNIQNNLADAVVRLDITL